MITTGISVLNNYAVLKNNVVIGNIDFILGSMDISQIPESEDVTIPAEILEIQKTVAGKSPAEVVAELNAMDKTSYYTKVEYIIEDDKVYLVSSFDDTLTYIDCTTTVNQPIIGATYDPIKNVFIPPKPNDDYILDETTFEWYPDPSKEFDLHGDGKLYRYNPENNSWIPTW